MNDMYPNLFKNLTRSSITIILLDNRKQTMAYDKTTKLSTLFEATCDLCYVDCDNLFGFAILMDDYYAFLDLDTKVCKINFKEFHKKTQSNILFKPWVSYSSPVHQTGDDNRRHSQGVNLLRDNHKLQHSMTSTKSAPVSHPKSHHTSTDDDTPVIYFRIKSYVYTHCLRDRMTKMLYFQQLMRNVLEYKLQCADEIYLQLGAYAMQAFYGDFNILLSSVNDDRLSTGSSNTDSSTNTYSPTLVKLTRSLERTEVLTKEQILSGRYFEPKKFFPTWIITKYSPEYLYKEISQLHKGLAGLSRFEAEFCYIRMASAQHSNFNMHLFPVRNQTTSGGNSGVSNFPGLISNGKQNGMKYRKNRLWLGLSPAGLEMHEMKNSDFLIHMSTLKWVDISEVTQKSYRINVHVGCRSLKLYTNTKMQADHLFWLTRHMHMYQTKARLNATCTAESLDNVERQKYREKYVYMDLEDLRQHGVQIVEANEHSNEPFSPVEYVIETYPKYPIPLVNTPAVPPRRTPSKARPMKMKDLMRMTNSANETANGGSHVIPDTTKKPQYIKKSNPSGQSNNYTNAIQKVIRSPEILPKEASPAVITCVLGENGMERHSFQSDIDSDQNTSRVYEAMDESDIASSLNESEGRSPGQFGLKHTGRFISLSQDFSHFDDFPPGFAPENNSTLDLLPPKEFRESSLAPPTHIIKSISFDIYDIVTQKQQQQTAIPQRQLSEPQLCNASLYRSLPMIMGLCHEFNETKILDDIKSTRLPKAMGKREHSKTSVGMKSWKSDILFHLNNCVDSDDDDNSVVINDSDSVIEADQPHTESQYSSRNSLPHQPCSYRDIISSSSTLDTDNDNDDSVDISSLSSFDFDYMSHSRLHRKASEGQKAHLTII